MMYTPAILAVSAAVRQRPSPGVIPDGDAGVYTLVGIVLTVVLFGVLVAGVVGAVELRLSPESALYCALPGPDGETCTRLERHAGLHRNAYHETAWALVYAACRTCGGSLTVSEAQWPTTLTCRTCGGTTPASRFPLHPGESLVTDYDDVVAVAQPVSVD